MSISMKHVMTLCSLLTAHSAKVAGQGRCLCKDPGTDGPRAPCYEDRFQPFGWPGEAAACHTGDFPKSSDDPKLAECLPQEQGQAIYIIGDSFAWAIQGAFQHATNLPVHHASWTCTQDRQGEVNPDVGVGALAKVIKPNDIVVLVTSPDTGPSKHIDPVANMTHAKGAKLLILGGWPVLPQEASLCYMSVGKTAKPGDKSKCWQPYEQWEQAIAARTEQVSQKLDKDITTLDLASAMCSKDTGCDMWIPGTSLPAYLDIAHVNTPMNQYLAKYVCEYLDEKFSVGSLH
eukprot:TRINITY_DN4455_c0_g1_i1.p1 TRINITY_DN4455_c0_g1~~TRINITY_DN4455_c0_g1_i1.p1  ORF type:complete len:289 (-),score=33.08 TRINITY_DN4455_c0_g1_i1:47-913(-)